MKLTPRAILAGGAAVTLAAAIFGSAALAQAQSSSPSGAPAANSAPSGYQNFLQHLATRLNLSTSQVDSAIKGAGSDAVADAVQAGRITQQQADQINQRIQNGGPFPFALGGAPGGPRPFAGRPPAAGQTPILPRATVLNAEATALNMKPEDLQAQLRAGKSLRDVATAQNVDFGSVQTAVSSAVKTALDQALSSGRITAQQEQRMLDRINSNSFGTGHPGANRRPAPGPRPSPSASPSAS